MSVIAIDLTVATAASLNVLVREIGVPPAVMLPSRSSWRGFAAGHIGARLTWAPMWGRST